tara:strand:+ start:1646 stop:1819 length:174 start_codon:yes stop_codon:yes gene_type:complete
MAKFMIENHIIEAPTAREAAEAATRQGYDLQESQLWAAVRTDLIRPAAEETSDEDRR